MSDPLECQHTRVDLVNGEALAELAQERGAEVR